MPAARELSLKALAAALGGKRAAMAEIGQAQRASGYVKGGISPFGQRQRARRWSTARCGEPSVFVNGGRRGLEIDRSRCPDRGARGHGRADRTLARPLGGEGSLTAG